MKITKKLSLLVLLICKCCYSQSIDYRQTYIKPGYGVNFDRIDHVAVSYTHLTLPTKRIV